MVDNPEVIRKQMEETRSQLTDKLEALETQVADTVQATSSAVSETVENVKETVENVTEAVKDTVQSVSNTFNLRLQTERHPWIVFGGAMTLGCVAAHWLGRSAPRGQPEALLPEAGPASASGEARAREEEWRRAQPTFQAAAPWEPAAPEKKSWFWDEVARVKGLAVASLLGVVRDMASRSLPNALGHRVAEEVDELTRKLGADPIHGPVLPTGK